MIRQYRETGYGFDKFWVALEIERGLLELVIDLVHGFEGVVLKIFSRISDQKSLL